jgi:hypothetical protein
LIRITHIINPVKVSENSDLYKSQPITFASILRAKEYTDNLCKINLCTTQFQEDKAIIPDGFFILSNLTRSVLDVNPKLSGKKLPLIADIFDKFNEAPDAEYCIYTNSDIALMPYFYNVVHQYVLQGYDAIVINRRRLSKIYADELCLEMMYADLGKSHPGFDCFVIKKDLINRLILDNICVGIPFVEVALVHNLCSLAKKPLFLPDAHLTFHIGLDVMPERNKDFYWHNRLAYFTKVQPILKPHFNLSKFPYAALAMHKRAIKWVLNPGLFTRNYLELETKSIGKKLKYLINEWRWNFLQK